MITGKLKHIGHYKGMSPGIDSAIDYIMNADLCSLDFGKHIINEDVFLIKSEYDTKQDNELLYEAHRKYIDLQVIVSGEEIIYGGELSFFCEEIPYDADKEAAFYTGRSDFKILCNENTFALFYTEDAHMPGVTNKEKSRIVKIVFKIK